MRKNRVPAPAGIPDDLHALLLSRAPEIDALLEVGSPLPVRRR